MSFLRREYFVLFSCEFVDRSCSQKRKHDPRNLTEHHQQFMEPSEPGESDLIRLNLSVPSYLCTDGLHHRADQAVFSRGLPRTVVSSITYQQTGRLISITKN